jgi:hypothetical protein
MGVYNNNKDGTRSTLANTIQVIDAPMEQFVSRGEFNAVVPSDTSADNKLVNDDTVNDIWKVQGELGAKNLLVYPYPRPSGGYNGVTFTAQSDGSFLVNGTATGYAHLNPYVASGNESAWSFFNLPSGKYAISIKVDNIEKIANGSVGFLIRFTDTRVTPNVIKDYKVQSDNPSRQVVFEITQEDVETLNNGDIIFEIRIFSIGNNAVIDNVIAYPMIRYASDADDTWQPYAPTNYQLNQKVDTIAGVYLPNATNANSKKVVASVGQTSVTFDATAFMSRYNVTSDDLDLDISAETASGDVVSYNNVSVTGGIVTVTFDALAEQTTFICKCSVIQ